MITLAPKTFTVRLTTPAGVVFFSADPSPAFRLILAPAIRGERGPVGPQGTTFVVSATPPEDPFEGMLWLDIS
jgi:hypothetical protein